MNIFKINLLVILSLFLISSCNEDKLTSETNSSTASSNHIEKSNDSLTQFPNVRRDDRLRQSMVSFVDAIDPFYEQGMSYGDLKSALDPDNSLSNMKSEGDILLKQAYTYLKNNTRDSNMSGDKLLDAYATTLQNPLVANKDFNDITEQDHESINRDLFGLSNDYEVTTNSDCDWWQVGCHLGWLAGEIAEWWNTPAPGDGDKTNGDVVMEIATFAALFLL